MPQAYCQNCGRTFANFGSYQKHLNAKKNGKCFEALVSRNEAPHGLSRHNQRSRAYQETENRDEFLNGLEDLLTKERAANKRGAVDVAQFECDPDELEKQLPPPHKTIRVGDLSHQKQSSSCIIKDVFFISGKGNGTQQDCEPCGRAECNLHSSERTNTGTGVGSHDNDDIMDELEAPANQVGGDNEMANDDANPMEDMEVEVEPGGEAAVHEDANDGGTPVAGVPANLDSPPLEQFKDYIDRAKKDFIGLSPEMKASVELMYLMNTCGGSATLYNEIMKWHATYHSQETVIGADQLHTKLIARYNLGPTLPRERLVSLPNSKEKTNLACHDAKAMLVDLLSDPRLCDDDYLFFENDPTAGIPAEFERVGDVNTGRAYRETYNQLIAPEPYTESGRRRVLLPLIFYIDGCQYGNFSHLNIEILKFTIGLFKGATREHDWAWRPLGYVRKRCKRNQTAKENIQKSSHVEAVSYLKDATHRAKQFPQMDGPAPDFDWEVYAIKNGRQKKGKKKAPRINAQDFHAMLNTIMASYKTIEEEGGLEWDLRYHAQTFPLVLVPFIIFMKADSVEADKLCGAYGSKSKDVKSICRYCCIPTAQTAELFLDPAPRRKTQEYILDLVRKAYNGEDEETREEAKEELKSISQHCLWNTLYQFRFGLHDNSGIHGASPWEILHWIQLGMYKYDREALFLQTGETTKLSRDLDALAQTYGTFLGRQSDRTLDRVAFHDGIRTGKMQANEMKNVIILLAMALRSRAGRNLILDTARKAQRDYFPTEQQIKDWIELLESHLMFEEWLRKEEFSVEVLERAKTRLKDMLQFTKTVGQRSKGMGYNTANFHGTTHMPEIALNLCAFIYMNTGCNESHHRKDKASAKRTNKQMSTFDISHATKVVQRESVELAMEEINGTINKWDYYQRGLDRDIEEDPFFEPTLRGPITFFSYSGEENRWVTKTATEMIGKEKYVYDDNTMATILAYAEDIHTQHGVDVKSFQAYGTLDVFSKKCKNSTQHFYARPYYAGKPWNDWAIFDLSDPESETPQARKRVPCQIKCFLDFSRLPAENALMKPPGVYAIVEPTIPNAAFDEKWWSKLLDPCCKLPSTIPGYEQWCQQELVSIFQIVDTAIVVPDHDNPNPRAFLRMVPMSLWGEMFEDWIMAEQDGSDDEE